MSLFSVTQRLFEGFSINFQLFVGTLLFALPLGLLISFGSMSRFRPLRWLVRTYVWIIRGTPLMLQLIIVFYGPGLMFGMSAMQRMHAAFIAFVINYSAYFCEIFRGGIEAIPRGQYEAGQVLGMTKNQIFFKVVLLQVIKRIVPPMSNEIITLVKDTSLARIIAIQEIIWVSQDYIASKGAIWPLFYSGVFYLVFCGLLTIIFHFIEKKLDYFRV